MKCAHEQEIIVEKPEDDEDKDDNKGKCLATIRIHIKHEVDEPEVLRDLTGILVDMPGAKFPLSGDTPHPSFFIRKDTFIAPLCSKDTNLMTHSKSA